MELLITYHTLSAVMDRLMSNAHPMDNWLPEEHTFWHAYQFVCEVDNGGFHQYFFNFTGSYVTETLSALTSIGASDFVNILQEAIAVFPDSTVPTDTAERRSLLADADIGVLRALADCFYDRERGSKITDLLIDYIRTNMQATVLPMFMNDASNKAAVEFRKKNYEAVIDLLAPFEDDLEGTTLAKFKLAQKKVSG